jgi:hypothetical protein
MNFNELKKIIAGLLKNQMAQQDLIQGLNDKTKDLKTSKQENDSLTN